MIVAAFCILGVLVAVALPVGVVLLIGASIDWLIARLERVGAMQGDR